MSPNPSETLAVAIVPTCLATVAVALRLHIRIKRRVCLGRDDWTALLSLILTWCLAAVVITGVALGILGGHTPIDPTTGRRSSVADRQKIVKLVYTASLLAPLTYGCIKLSVLFLYRRLFIGTTFHYYSLTLCALLFTWTLAFFFAFAFSCGVHPEYWWLSPTTRAKCDYAAFRKYNLAFAVSDVVTDLMVLLTPLPIVWKLKMSIGERVGVSVVFGLGFLSTAAAVARLVYVVVYDWTAEPNGGADIIAINTIDMVWSHVEASIGVIAACLPTLKPLVHGSGLRTWIARTRGSSHSKLSAGGGRDGSGSGHGEVKAVPTKRDTLERDIESLRVGGWRNSKVPFGKIVETRTFEVFDDDGE